MTKKILTWIISLIWIYSIIFLAQLWGKVFTSETFVKLTITFWVIIFFLSIWFMFAKANKEDENNEKWNYIG
ncbi:MAG: hypothetical protein ACD_4C00405G0004 [uncultured bacterium (gcode 4)]|uniref:Uncharacterized protein n=1 Tax=uncultured bacterium (gcode 4) TaxID=1234023 RepID=K2FWC4_9BACT|nr:MAG: hypothetical protein ACD_4C00405G0004 [uncultured bacterium (gcode 4)]